MPSKGFEEDLGIWWVSNRPGDVLFVAISLRLTLGQECINFCWTEERKAGRKRETRACVPHLIQILFEKDPLQKYRKIDGKWEQGGRK